MSPATPPSSEWARRTEHGSVALLRFMVWASRKLGRAPVRVLLRIIAAYFLVFDGGVRRASGAFLERCLGRKPTLAERYRIFFNFASTIHDRVFFLGNRFDLFDIEVHGTELFDESEGALLMGAHFGSFEVLRSCGRYVGRSVAMAMYQENALMISSVLAALDPAAQLDIVALGHVDSMLKLAGRLEEGAIVGMLADRTPGDEPVVKIPFLGRPAAFATGPMRVAAALRRRVIFMSGIYRGGNRYEVHFEPLADFTSLEGLARAERDERVRQGVAAFAHALERRARQFPDNWFNFHDFWRNAA
jgi:predicted LPLAT superfamily acyltransferase